MAGLQVDAEIAAISETQRHLEINEKVDEKVHSDDVSSEVHHELERDGIHDGLEFPTKEERATLRRVSDAIPWNAYCVHISSFQIYGLLKVSSSDCDCGAS